jgi:hypothetical protein
MQQRGKTCWGEGDYDHRALTEREGRPSLTLHPLPAAGGQAREGRPLRCISGQAAAARRVVVVDTPHWGAAAASPAGATAADSCSSQQEHASANSDGMSRMRPAGRQSAC